MKYFGLGFTTAIIIMAIAGLSFMLGRKSGRQQISLTPTPTISSIITSTSTPTPKGFSQEESIIFAISEKSYEALLPFLSDNVEIRIENQNCCGILKKEDAIKKMVILDKAQDNWDFNENSIITKNLTATYPEHYANALIGLSKNKYSVALQYNAKKLVEKISISTNYSTLVK